jgi:RNA polymerase sigma factor (TIGR02999 family)
MALPRSNSVTQLLLQWRTGDKGALEALIPLVYQELRAVAHHYLQHERPGHTLQSTALVHEVYLRLMSGGPIPTQNRAHFFAVAARLMRQILVDYSRAHQAEKRGAGCKIVLDEEVEAAQVMPTDVVALNDALNALTQRDEQQGTIVELRCFGGLTIEETAEVLNISPATVKRDWKMAKAWLSREIRRNQGGKNGNMEQT